MAEFYQNQDIVVRFDVLEDGKPVEPNSASVAIYAPDGQFLGHGNVEIMDSEVRCILQGDNVDQVGKYRFMFQVKVRGFGGNFHVVNVDVKESPIPIENKEVQDA